jgi:alpha-beta hydrolase superfamily lysophospholipase
MEQEQGKGFRPASSGNGHIYYQVWTPPDDAAPRAVIQIAHGMSETLARYIPFAQYLAASGFVVCMNEHAGHGPYAETLGYFARRNGTDYLVEDMKRLMDEVNEAYNPDGKLPVFLLGHSMGSFLARLYAARYGKQLAGLVLSGTSGKVLGVGAGKAIATVQKKAKGPESTGKLLTVIVFGTYNRKIKNPVNRVAWLSRDDAVCKAYRQDPYCGFRFTAGGYYDLFYMNGKVNRARWYKKVPAQLPILLFSGSDDPVGAYGKGVIEVYRKLRQSGHADVTATLYPGGRHEMLNEINKEEVYADTLHWLLARI